MADVAMVDLDDAPLRPFHRRLALAATGGVFADGYGLGIIGIALSLAVPELELRPLWLGLIGGASLAGLFAGALLTGPAADRFGRRPIFACNMALTAVLALLQFACQSGWQLLSLRLAIGFLLGTDYVVSKALLSEHTPRHARGRTLGLLSVAWAGGYACAYAVGFALTALGPHAWRWMLLSSALPCLAVAPLRVTIPESPRWLLHRGTPAAAADAPHRWRELFAPAWRRRTLVACTFFACQVIPYFAVGTFVAQIMSALRLQGGYLGGLLYNLSLLGGAFAGLWMVDRLSRRRFLIGSFTIAAAAMLLLSLWSSMGAVLMIALFALFAGVLSAASNLVYVYLPELFPTALRASGIGLAVAASRVGSAVSTFLLPIVVAQYGVRAALGACVAVLAIGALLCLRWAPETAHTPLDALDRVAPGTGVAA